MLGECRIIGGGGSVSASSISNAIAKESNCKIVYPGDDLQAAYEWLKSSSRDAQMGTRSETAPRTLLLMPGVYTLTGTLDFNAASTAIHGLGRVEIVYAGNGDTIDVGTSLISLRNVTVRQTSGNSAYRAIRFGWHGFTNDVVNVLTVDSAVGQFYFDHEAPVQQCHERPLLEIDPDMFASGWVREPSWKGTINHIATKTPWRSNGYVQNIAHPNSTGAFTLEVRKDLSAAPLDLSQKAVVLAYTIQDIRPETYTYASSSSDGGWVIVKDGLADSAVLTLGMPVIPGRHMCVLPCIQSGIDWSDIVEVNIRFKNVTTGITTNLPEVWLEDWGIIDCSAMSPRICINIDDGFQRSVDNLIWPLVHAGIKTSFGIRYEMVGLEDMVTWPVIKALHETGLVEISPHISTWPGHQTLAQQAAYIRFSKQIFRANGISGPGLDTLFIPQGTGGTAEQRPGPQSFNLMRSYYKYYRGIQPHLTGADGVVNQSGDSGGGGVVPGKPFYPGFLPASTMDTVRMGSVTGSDTSKMLDTGGHFDRVVAANMTGIYYTHNVSNDETLNSETLDNLKKSEADGLITKLIALKGSGVEMIFTSDV